VEEGRGGQPHAAASLWREMGSRQGEGIRDCQVGPLEFDGIFNLW
jgi:hypothetical protein